MRIFTELENKQLYDWAVNRVEQLLPLVDVKHLKTTHTSSS